MTPRPYKPEVELRGALDRRELSWAITCAAEVKRIVSSSGVTCVNLDPSIDVSTATAVVSAHGGLVVFTVGPGCTTKSGPGLQVQGTNMNNTNNATETFSIIVP
jgi:hypothetical protein